jgi:transcriptional regulator with XRE-family HTH domain
MSLAKKLVDLRKEHNLTQKELAKSIGVHFSHMSRYERGISHCRVENPRCRVAAVV